MTLRRRARIVATIGPASRDPEVLARLLAAGMDVARVNFSHGTRAEHEETIARLRAQSARSRAPLAILADLSGPKLRVGGLARPLQVSAGQRVSLGAGGELPTTMPELVAHLRPGHQVLIDDGAVECRVVSADGGLATLEVQNAGVISSQKGINLPDTPLPISAMTPKDHDDLAFALAHDVDYLALSFVRSAADVHELKAAVGAAGGRQLVVAKIEKREALDHIDEIIAAADAIMVARGDLGVEIPPAEVPLWQKQIVARAIAEGRPVITATQMLQSMIENPRPTRAEVSDVANAILELTDAVMLSGETAVGRYPVEAVAMMASIAEVVERGTRHEYLAQRRWEAAEASVADAVSYGAIDVARKLGAAAIATATASGATARAVAKNRPEQPIIAVSHDSGVVNQLALSWGVTPVLGRRHETFERVINEINDLVLERGLCGRGETIVITAGVLANRPGATNLIKAHVLQ